MVVGAAASLAVVSVGVEASIGFIANEIKDEALSQATGGLSVVVDISKNIKNIAQFGFKKLDIGGGFKSKQVDALNIDPQAESGFKGTLDDFIEQAGTDTKFDEIIVDNPRFDFLNGASKLLKEGGTIKVSGTVNNGFFNKVLKGKLNGSDGFNISSPTKTSNKGFTQSDGKTPIQKEMFKVELTKK